MGAGNSKTRGPIVTVLPAERAGESGIYRDASAKNGLLERIESDVTTLYESFSKTCKKHPFNKYLGWRVGDGPYRWMSYKMANIRATNIASGLRNLGLVPHKSRIGIYSLNRAEWILTGHACDAQSICLVPLYDTLGPTVVDYIVNQAELSAIACSGNHVSALLDGKKGMPVLETLISFDPVTQEQMEQASALSVKLLTLEQVEEDGKANVVAPDPPSFDEVQTICYTSGTTGDPKGVLLTHGNLLADAAGVVTRMAIMPTDVHVSYLPLAHSFERLTMNLIAYFGASAGFYRGDVKQLFDDIQALRPTMFVSVPRLWNRLYDKVWAQVRSTGGVKQKLFETAYESKLEGLKDNELTHMLYDSIVFGKVKAKLGGRVRVMVTGSAPLSDTVMNFLRVCFSVPVIEGYGQTENAAGLTTQLSSQQSCGHVGFVIPSAEIKLIDLPAQDYLSSDKPYPRGEICFRGPIATQGYFKNKKKTDELIDEHGWLHTGDVGLIYPDGRLKIIDRSKNIFKLAQGEYVAPEKLENIYVQSEWVAQAFVYGDSLKASLVAVVVPDFETLLPWCKEQGIAGDEAKLVQNEKVVALIKDDMIAKGKANGLLGFELIRSLALYEEPFSVDNDLITPTFKLKRPQARKFFQGKLDKMYETLQ
eukprot:TRINITY_DN2746_c0_g1_i1.p1 TRINITY_DN2746_c0_g1~~TRINITY_DN2746_c0_g1_i1.p1  ORF type:complete len:649 (-),score=154.76 TRINITY_DN2746_c0_g1_i1:37-1983(-)